MEQLAGNREFFTRRDFLKGSSSAAIAGALYFCLPQTVMSEPGTKSRVVLVRNKGVLDKTGTPDPAILAKMLDDAVVSLTETSSPDTAWKKLVNSKDTVGIKSNACRFLPTPSELEKTIVSRLVKAGVSQKNISVKDRKILDDNIFINSTALINVRPLRTHHWSGIGSLIKNYIMFVKEPWNYHDDSCADLAKLWSLPIIKGKTRLNILVLLTPQFHGIGPHSFNPKYTWHYNGLLVGFDPVAVDATGVRILQAKRGEYFQEERPINPPPKHVFLADTRHGLGTADPSKIDLVKIGWEDNLLLT